jgi:methylmalonyl-CoA mutase, C-terminal domain
VHDQSRTRGHGGASRAPRGRVLVAKLGLDGHDLGAKVVARVLRDAGFEVVYLGIRQTPETVVAVAIAEDVDVIGISILSGAHVSLGLRLLELLALQHDRRPVVIGGTVPASDRDVLAHAGVTAFADASMPLDAIVDLVTGLVDSSAAEHRDTIR